MLTKDDVVYRLAEMGYTKKDAMIAVNDILWVVTDALANGDSVQFHGFGTFDAKDVAARETIDIRSKERIVIPPYKAPKFTAGKQLKRAVKEGFARE